MFVKVHTTLSEKTNKVVEKEIKITTEKEIDIGNVEIGKEVVVKRISPENYPVFFTERFNSFKRTGSIVNYDTTSVNIGNGLNQTSGVFTAPVTGIYVLYFLALKTMESDHMTIRVMHNGKAVNSRQVSEGDKVGGNHWANLETQVILPLEAEDTVGVKLQTGTIQDVLNVPSEYGFKITTFSGFLLQGPMSSVELMSYTQ